MYKFCTLVLYSADVPGERSIEYPAFANAWPLSATLTDHRADINGQTENKKNCQRFSKLKEVFANAQADTKHHI
ncbi:MAG: hypothetical protein JSS64_06260 [Bacteroidetes bacterium]|nr:hypothetical protein [Bacteroidota bacterium]